MERLQSSESHDSFGWRIAACLRSTACELEAWSELGVLEAEELVHGRRHVTIVHGDPAEIAASRHLSGFYEELRRLSAGCEWVRVRGNAEYVTVTVGGAVADEQIALFEAAAAFANPGDWTIVATAVPPLS